LGPVTARRGRSPRRARPTAWNAAYDAEVLTSRIPVAERAEIRRIEIRSANETKAINA
jgi:hypothetical protein